MKKILIPCFCLIGFLVLLVACSNVTLFNKVQVKGSPSIYASLGGKKVEAKSFLSADKLSSLFGQDSKFKIYNYTGGSSDALTFLMQYDILDMPLNFDEYLSELDMSELNTSIPKIEFTIPKFDLSLSPQVITIPDSSKFDGRQLTADEAEALNKLVKQAGELPMEERKILVQSEGLKSAVLEPGNKITMTLKPTMAGILVSASNLSITLPGSTEKITFTEGQTPGSFIADFSDKTITNGELVINGAITVSSNVTAGTQVSAEGVGVKVDITLDLNQGFSSVTKEVPAGTELTQTVNVPLPEEMTKLVSSIVFNTVGAKVTLNNGLPTGNDINITVSSSTLGITGNDGTFPAGKEVSQEFTGSNVTLNPAETPNIDMKMDVELPGYKQDEKTFTVKNIVPGKTYSVGGNINFAVDWKKATIKTNTPFEGSFPGEGEEPINLSGLWDKVPKGITFKSIGAYLYFNAPIDLTMSGYMKVNETSLMGSEEKPEELKSVEIPVVPVEGDWTTSLDSIPSSADLSEGITTLLNSYPDTLSLSYFLKANEVTINKEQITGDKKIKATLILTLPLELEVNSTQEDSSSFLPNLPFDATKGVVVDVMKLADVYSKEDGANNDLFQRAEPWSTEGEINSLLDQLTRLTLEVGYTNEFDMEVEAWLFDEKSGLSKDFILDRGKGDIPIGLTTEEIKKVMNAYPFSPHIYVLIPNTSKENPLKLNRDGAITFTIAVVAASDINYTYDLKGGK